MILLNIIYPSVRDDTPTKAKICLTHLYTRLTVCIASTSYDSEYIFILLYMLNHVYFLSDRASPVTNHLGHLTLWILVNSDDRRYEELMLQSLRIIVNCASCEELKSFFQEAAFNKGLSLPLAELFCAELLNECNLNFALNRITSLLSVTSVYCPSVLRVKAEKSPQTLTQCIRIACQRQICLGTGDRETNHILEQCLSVIRYVCLPIQFGNIKC